MKKKGLAKKRMAALTWDIFLGAREMMSGCAHQSMLQKTR
jgi:hypothetical protein